MHWPKEEEVEEEENKIESFTFGFPTVVKVRGTYRVDLAIVYQRDLVGNPFELLCFVFHGAVPIPYALYRRPFELSPSKRVNKVK